MYDLYIIRNVYVYVKLFYGLKIDLMDELKVKLIYVQLIN